MIRVVKDDEEIVLEDRLRFLEGDAVLSNIVGGLIWIPLEAHVGIIDPREAPAGLPVTRREGYDPRNQS